MILASIVALKYCAIVLVVSLAGWIAASWLDTRTHRGSLFELIVEAYVFLFYVSFVGGLIALPVIALLNLLRAGGML